MREIKFRAWNEEQRCMAKWGNIEMGCRNYPNEFITFEPIPSWSTDKYELMQFTGLHDKNGKEIYEGDILAFHQLSCFSSKHGEIYEDAVAVVIWPIVCAGFTLNIIKGHLHSLDMEKGEIIGNIYENPELIKKEN